MSSLPILKVEFRLQFSGVTSTTCVSNCAAVGFGGNFLRNTTTGPTTTLTLTGLSGHTSINLNFLLAIVSSWDGTSTSIAPDYFDVRVDGNLIFHHIFNHTESSDQSYPEGSNQLIPRNSVGGFPNIPAFGGSSGWGDTAYNMGQDSTFDNIPHSASTLTVQWSGRAAMTNPERLIMSKLF